MLFHAGQEHPKDRESDEAEHERRDNSAKTAGLERIVRQVRLDDAFDIGLLALRLAAGLLERGQRRGELLAREVVLERNALILDRRGRERAAIASDLAELPDTKTSYSFAVMECCRS